MRADFCARCGKFTDVFRRSGDFFCQGCLDRQPLSAVPKAAPVEATAPRNPSKATDTRERQRKPRAASASRLKPEPEKIPVFPKPGTLPYWILKILKRHKEPIRITVIREDAVVRGYSLHSVRCSLDTLVKRGYVYNRQIYKDGHRAYTLYSLEPFPALIEGEPIKRFLDTIQGQWVNVPTLAAKFGCSRTNVKHLFDRAIKKGYKVEARLTNNCRFYTWNP